MTSSLPQPSDIPEPPDIPEVIDDPFFAEGDSYFTCDFMMVWDEALADWTEQPKPAPE